MASAFVVDRGGVFDVLRPDTGDEDVVTCDLGCGVGCQLDVANGQAQSQPVVAAGMKFMTAIQ